MISVFHQFSTWYFGIYLNSPLLKAFTMKNINFFLLIFSDMQVCIFVWQSKKMTMNYSH